MWHSLSPPSLAQGRKRTALSRGTATLFHGVSEAAAYGEQYKKWSYDSLPILPQEWKYTVAADKKAQFDTLKDLMRRDDVSEVVNACDAGREGELIFRFVYEVAGCKKPMRRLWISSMEDEVVWYKKS